MVRVISVHHFVSQHVQTVEQPTACTIAFPDKLLIALTSNCVEVRDLKNESDVLFTFPTVDEVIKIVHCRNGDFVAALETKFNRQNKEINFVRVYINWDSIAAMQQSKMTSSGVSLGSSECGMVQPMRARIAGRVTPTTNQSELGSLEMIEIPVRLNPSSIECCQISGNLFVLAGKVMTIYGFCVKTHDISKLKFVDFEELKLAIELPFVPTIFDVCEDYIACLNQDSMYLFRISYKGKGMDASTCDIVDSDFFYSSQDEPIDVGKLLRENDTNAKIIVNLPTIVRENSLIHNHSPFVFCDKDMEAKIQMSAEMRNQNLIVEVTNLIQLKLVPILVESVQRQITEEFKCVLLKPLYVDESLHASRRPNSKSHQEPRLLKSDFRQCLNSVVCVIATQQEGYLYYFNETETMDTDKCVAVYPFTAPVQQLVMEDYFLHALTETGLESYTLRFGQKLCRSIEVVEDVNVACPSISDPICLVGLRPFLGVEKILLSERNLVLLANSDISPTHSVSSNSSSNAAYWTLYNLELPRPQTIFNDISIVANGHRFTSSQTYCHLLSEAHIILRMALLLKRWNIGEDNVRLIYPLKIFAEDVVETYRTSCALLADHYIMCSIEADYKMAVPYYKMSRSSPAEVLQRVKKIQHQSNHQVTRGLMYYLKTIMAEVKHSWQCDRLFNKDSSRQNFADALLEILESHGSFSDLPYLIVRSGVLREYSTDKLIGILCNKLDDEACYDEKYLSLALLYIQKCNTNRARGCLEKVEPEAIKGLLTENWELLFDGSNQKSIVTFSDLGVILMSMHPDMLADILVTLVLKRKTVSLNKIIKVFLEYLPASIGNDSNTARVVLQRTLELYFQTHFCNMDRASLVKMSHEKGTGEAVKLLVRSYLSELQILQFKEEVAKGDEMKSSLTKLERDILGSGGADSDEEKNPNSTDKAYFEDKIIAGKEAFLFADLRHAYLDKMPPFQIEFTTKLYEACVENYVPKVKLEKQGVNPEADRVLKKIQAILCTPIASKQLINEVGAFAQLNDNIRGGTSLQTLVLNTNDAVSLLIEACPQCLLQFGKDRFCRVDEWTFLIATVQKRIVQLSQDESLKRICFFHKKILKDTLTHLATSLNVEQLLQVFPQKLTESCETDEAGDFPKELLKEIQDYEPYITMCKEMMHANQIHKLIVTTAQQLLCTLNL